MENKGKNLMFCGIGDNSALLYDVKNISVYSSAYDCLMEESFLPGEITREEKDFCDFLRHVDDWESINYIVINSETVVFCDSINGDVGGFCKLSAFLSDMQAEFEKTI